MICRRGGEESILEEEKESVEQEGRVEHTLRKLG
jgi:hypothetical protein